MDPLNSLYLVLSVSIIVITLCLVVTFGYLIVILKRFHDVQRTVQGAVEHVSKFVESVKERIEHSTSHLATLVELGARLFEYVKSKKKDSKKKSEKVVVSD